MTDLTPEMGSTASCPRCGFQVSIPQRDDEAVRCPSCGEVVPGGWRDQATSDLTNDELLRAFGVRGYLTDVVVEEPASLRCDSCGVATDASGWIVEDLRLASNMTTPGASESAVAALQCPNCQELGRVELMLRGDDEFPDDRIHRDLLDSWGRSTR